MKRAYLLMVVGALSWAAAFALAATPATAMTATANAKVTPVSVHQHYTSEISKASASCPIYPGNFVTFDSTCTGTAWSCSHGNSSSLYPPAYVSNGCGTRVWLYQNRNRTGYNLCIKPNSATGHLNRTYRAFWVSSNPAGC